MSLGDYRLVTLLEILETSAEAWWRLASVTGQLLVRLEVSIPPFENIGATLSELQIECEKLDLRLACVLLQRIHDDLILKCAGMSRAEFADKLRQMVADLNMRIWDEVSGKFFLVIPADSVGYYHQDRPLFGIEVEEQFPQMSEDIAEAGKCLALGRSTASVFHCMRAMEIGLQRFGNKIGVQFAAEKNWQNILDEINKKIKAMDQKLPITKSYAEASAHLYNVKLCWRNEVMHPKQTYTVEEAKRVFSSVETFIHDLARLL